MEKHPTFSAFNLFLCSVVLKVSIILTSCCLPSFCSLPCGLWNTALLAEHTVYLFVCCFLACLLLLLLYHGPSLSLLPLFTLRYSFPHHVLPCAFCILDYMLLLGLDVYFCT